HEGGGEGRPPAAGGAVGAGVCLRAGRAGHAGRGRRARARGRARGGTVPRMRRGEFAQLVSTALFALRGVRRGGDSRRGAARGSAGTRRGPDYDRRDDMTAEATTPS